MHVHRQVKAKEGRRRCVMMHTYLLLYYLVAIHSLRAASIQYKYKNMDFLFFFRVSHDAEITFLSSMNSVEQFGHTAVEVV